jgi:N-acetylglucosamine kinase-like BadF-type ATPase
MLGALGAGFAGAGTIPSHAPLRQLLAAALAAAVRERPVTVARSLPIAIHHDMVIALAAGSSTRNGIVVIAGTGSSVYGERDAASVRVGGWGPAFGDEGSGYAIGHQALRSVMQVYDGRLPASALTDAICGAWQCAAPPELLTVWRARQPTVAEVGQLTPVVAATAEHGDWLACAILQDAAAELARCVITAATELDFGEESFPLIMSGGVLHHVPLVADELIAQVAAAAPGVAPRVLDIEPVNGAIHIARQLLR